MLTAPSQKGKLARRLTALLVAAWLTGASCLFCCEGAAFASPPGESETASALPRAAAPRGKAAGAAMKADHSCCRAKLPGRGAPAEPSARGLGGGDAGALAHADPSAPEEAAGNFFGGPSRPRGARSCCENTGQTRDAARWPRAASHEQASSPAAAFADAGVASRDFTPRAVPRARVPDRGGTYLLTRVFLI